MKLKGRVGIVTGGANGIGRAISFGLAREGADVVVADIDSKQADKVADEIKALGTRAIAFEVDVTQSHEVNAMVKAVLDEFGRIDILVNNAGGGARERATLFCKSTEDIWDSVIQRNLKSVFICSRAVIEHMMQRQTGKIVNISSTAGLVGQAGMADYSAAKAAVIGFTHALAQEVASYGINVNSVAPGPIGTRAISEFQRDRLAPLTGLGRVGRPEEIAAMVVFLATDDADFITGQVVSVCGLRNLGVRMEG